MDNRKPAAKAQKGVRRKRKKGASMRTASLQLDRLNFDPDHDASSIGSDYDWNSETPLITNGKVVQANRAKILKKLQHGRPPPSPATIARTQQKNEERRERRKKRWAKYAGSQSGVTDEASIDDAGDDFHRISIAQQKNAEPPKAVVVLPCNLSPEDMEICSSGEEDYDFVEDASRGTLCSQTNSVVLGVTRPSVIVGPSVPSPRDDEVERSDDISNVAVEAQATSTFRRTETPQSRGTIFVDPIPDTLDLNATQKQKTPRRPFSHTSPFGRVDPNTPRGRHSSSRNFASLSSSTSDHKQVCRVQSLPRCDFSPSKTNPTADTTTITQFTPTIDASDKMDDDCRTPRPKGVQQNPQAQKRPSSGAPYQRDGPEKQRGSSGDAGASQRGESQALSLTTTKQLRPICKADHPTRNEATVNPNNVGRSPVLRTPNRARISSNLEIGKPSRASHRCPQKHLEGPTKDEILCTPTTETEMPKTAQRQEPTKNSSLQNSPEEEMICTPATETRPNQTAQTQRPESTNASCSQECRRQGTVCTLMGDTESHQTAQAKCAGPSKDSSRQNSDMMVCNLETQRDDIPAQRATCRTDQTQFTESTNYTSPLNSQMEETICTPTTETDEIPEAELSEDMPIGDMVTTTHVLTITSRHRTPRVGIGALRAASVGRISGVFSPGARYNGTAVRSRGLPPGGRVVRTAVQPRQERLPRKIWTAELAETAVPGCGVNPIQTFVINGTEFMLPPLPAGWRVAVQNERPYYFHPDHGQSYCCPVVLPSTTESVVRRSMIDRSLLNSLSRVLLDRAQLDRSSPRGREEQAPIRIPSPSANEDARSSPTLNSPILCQQGVRLAPGSSVREPRETESLSEGSRCGSEQLYCEWHHSPNLSKPNEDVSSLSPKGSGLILRAACIKSPDVTFGATTNPQFSSELVTHNLEAACQRQQVPSSTPFHEIVANKAMADDDGSVCGKEATKNKSKDTPPTDDESTILDADSPTESSDAGSSNNTTRPSIDRDSPEGAFCVADQRLFTDSPQNQYIAVTSLSTQDHESSVSSLEQTLLNTPPYVGPESSGETPCASEMHNPTPRGPNSEQQQDDPVPHTSPGIERDTPKGTIVAQKALFSGSLASVASVQPPSSTVDFPCPGFMDMGPEFEDANDASSDNQEHELIEPSSRVDPGIPFNEVVATNSNDSVSALLEPVGKKPRKKSAKKGQDQPTSFLESTTVPDAPRTQTPAASFKRSPTNHKRHRGKRKGYSDRCYRGQLCFFQRLFMPKGQLQYTTVGCPCQACRAGNGPCQARAGASEPRRKKQRRLRRVS